MVKTTAGVVHHASRRAVWPKPRGITTTGTVAMSLPNVVHHVAAARREPNLLHRPRVEQAPARCLADLKVCATGGGGPSSDLSRRSSDLPHGKRESKMCPYAFPKEQRMPKFL